MRTSRDPWGFKENVFVRFGARVGIGYLVLLIKLLQRRRNNLYNSIKELKERRERYSNYLPEALIPSEPLGSLAVQINGHHVSGTNSSLNELEGHEILKIVHIPGKLINIITVRSANPSYSKSQIDK